MAYISTAKVSPTPAAQLAWWVVIPQHVAPNLKLLFPKYFSGTYGISVQIYLIDPFFLTGCMVHIKALSRIPQDLKLDGNFTLCKAITLRGQKIGSAKFGSSKWWFSYKNCDISPQTYLGSSSGTWWFPVAAIQVVEVWYWLVVPDFFNGWNKSWAGTFNAVRKTSVRTLPSAIRPMGHLWDGPKNRITNLHQNNVLRTVYQLKQLWNILVLALFQRVTGRFALTLSGS